MTEKRTIAKKQTIDNHDKDFLTESEMKRFLDAARKGRHGTRDFLLMLLAYRHALRVSELIDIRIKDLDLDSERIFVRRKKGSLSTHQPMEGDELRAIRAYLRERGETKLPYLFLSERGVFTRQAINYLVQKIGERAKLKFHVHPHMLRHSTGYYLANKGYCVFRGIVSKIFGVSVSKDFDIVSKVFGSVSKFQWFPKTLLTLPKTLLTPAKS